MDQPAALQKAEALRRHTFGARESCAITLCDREAWELLAWFQATQISYSPPEYQAEFQRDISRAQALNDPWPMLETFVLLGFSITRQSEEVH